MDVSFFLSVSVFKVHLWSRALVFLNGNFFTLAEFYLLEFSLCNFSLVLGWKSFKWWDGLSAVEFKNYVCTCVLNYLFCFSSFWWIFPILVFMLCCVALCLAALCVFVFPYVGYVTGHVIWGICILLEHFQSFCFMKFILNLGMILSPKLIILYTEFCNLKLIIFLFVDKWKLNSFCKFMPYES
jgi:hypothetical protein